VFLSSERRGDAVRRDAERLLDQLAADRAPANPQELGDPTLLPPGMEAVGLHEIANTFGTEFATQLEEAPVGQWSGPVQSGFGLHLVRVGERQAGTMPALADVRPIVTREWQAERRQQTGTALLSELRSKYDVRVEGRYAGLLDRAGPADETGARQ
jgi:hypothetical protein